MAVAARQGKPRKAGQDNNLSNQGNNPRNNRSAWRNSGTPTSFSPTMANQRLPGPQAQNGQHGFPPLAQGIQDKLASLSAQIGGTIIITSRTGQRHEGTVTTVNPEGDPAAGVILKDVKDLANPSGPLKETYFVPTTSIQSWVVAPPKPTNGTAPDSFRTDTDISGGTVPGKRERELQAWQSDGQPAPSSNFGVRGDEATFGTNAAGESWDQFAANEQLFGVTAGFDEEVYTTKLDRNAPDFKERERKAQQLANEILGSSTTNSHVAEERIMNNVGGNENEEEKYGAVVRGANAYVPPGARPKGPSATGSANPTPAPSKSEVPPIVANGPDDSASKTGALSGSAAPADNLVGTFRDFVTHEKQRLTQKKEAIVKHEMNKRMADLVKFSKSFKLSQPIPEDLVPILTKDVTKQKLIREKSSKDAESAAARAISTQASSSANASSTRPSPQVASPPTKDAPASTSRPATNNVKVSATATKVSKPSAPQASPARVPINMVIQKIPPFDPSKRLKNGAAASPTATPAARPDGSSPIPPSSPSASSTPKLNINASSFKPNPNASSFKPGAPSTAASSPKTKPTDATSPITTPNPFFGTRVIKKGTPVHIKDDFNPFKFAKVAEASAVSSTWPYSGKRFILLFPMPPPVQHMPPPQQMPPPPPYEEDSAQVAARNYGMVYAYAPYQYPTQPQQPQMMHPPGSYVASPYMQPMGYPHAMPPGGPPGIYGPPPTMAGMPPPQAYPLPPGAYPPPPNGAPGPRGSMPPTPMPPTPMPPHAYAYHHPSPQLGHAVPYHQMMMPPPAPPHGYDTGPGPGPGPGPVPMGGH